MPFRSLRFSRICAALLPASALVAVSLAAQGTSGTGGIAARARVLDAGPAQAGLRMAADVLRDGGWVTGSTRRAEHELTTVTLSVEPQSAVLSIQFLRN